MNRFGNPLRPLTWFTALLLAALVAGCGAAGGDGADPGLLTAAGAGSGVGGLGRGPEPVDLRTAGNFAILAEEAIRDVSPSQVIGDVGLTPASGTLVGLTCLEVTGLIYTISSAGPSGSCRVTNASRLTTAKNDGVSAFFDAKARAPDYVDLGGGNLGGRNLGPATYNWSTPVVIPSNLTLTGGPNDVWIFQIWQSDENVVSLSVSSGVQIILAGGALPQNVYWQIGAADLGPGSQFKGVMIADFSIVMRTGASIDGRVLAGSAADLDQNRVAQPVP